jgi:hypothetical protein
VVGKGWRLSIVHVRVCACDLQVDLLAQPDDLAHLGDWAAMVSR